MTNPWLGIPLSDYEAHMALPEVAQAKLLADVFHSVLAARRPSSVAVIGCAGGNGFDRIDTSITKRVVGVDINPEYVDVKRTLECLRPRLAPGGVLATVVQVPGPAMVTPSPLRSLESLGSFMRAVEADRLSDAARDAGFHELARRRERTPAGKEFDVQVFEAAKENS